MSASIYTIGHSNVTFDVFADALTANSIKTLVDIRTFPSSRHCPQFNGDALESSLRQRGIGYTWLKPLGGRRHSVASDSRHDGLRHPSYRRAARHFRPGGLHVRRSGLLALSPASCFRLPDICGSRSHAHRRGDRQALCPCADRAVLLGRSQRRILRLRTATR